MKYPNVSVHLNGEDVKNTIKIEIEKCKQGVQIAELSSDKNMQIYTANLICHKSAFTIA